MDPPYHSSSVGGERVRNSLHPDIQISRYPNIMGSRYPNIPISQYNGISGSSPPNIPISLYSILGYPNCISLYLNIRRGHHNPKSVADYLLVIFLIKTITTMICFGNPGVRRAAFQNQIGADAFPESILIDSGNASAPPKSFTRLQIIIF